MIDLDDVRKRPDAYQKAVGDKWLRLDVRAFLELDELRRGKIRNIEEMRARKNKVSKEIPNMKGGAKEKALADMKTLAGNLKKTEEELGKIEETWLQEQYNLPSIPLPSTPIGKDAKDNVEVSSWGDPKAILKVKNPKDHVAIGEALDILDIPRGVKVSGPRNYFLKGDGARLHLAVLRFTMDRLAEKGWTIFCPPLMAGYDCFFGTGFFPGVDQENIYALGGQTEKGAPIEGNGLHLIGTSEVPVCSYHKDEVLAEKDLPKRYAGMSACFRREAGTYGKDTKGLYRVHQFDKVEQVVLCRANLEEALALFEEIRTNAEEVLQALELPYRVVDVCTGDMGKAKVKMQDIETWMPSRNAYGETHSCSYLGDFQARRLNIKYDAADGTRLFVHTLNNTCIASPRILIPLLEIFQNADGTVTIPEVLRPYMGGREIIGASC